MSRSHLASIHRWSVAAAAAAFLIVGAGVGDAQVRYGEVQQGGGGSRCCVNNFRFAGTCEVTIGSGESCADVMSYLNNLQSVGKAYCGGTTVRGGWTTVRCQEAGSTVGVTSGGAVAAPPAQAPRAVRPAQTSPVGTAGQTFVTPVDASTATVQEAGILNF